MRQPSVERKIDYRCQADVGLGEHGGVQCLFELAGLKANHGLSSSKPQMQKGRHVADGTFLVEARSVETEIKFAGYLEQQKKSIERLKAAESVSIPDWIEYSAISGLSREMRETLERIRPMTIGQASRIPGVTPAALTLVHVSIKLQGKLQSKRQGEERRTPADSTTR